MNINNNNYKPLDFPECACRKCKKDCPHRESYRRLPICVGGLGLCENLKDKKG